MTQVYNVPPVASAIYTKPIASVRPSRSATNSAANTQKVMTTASSAAVTNPKLVSDAVSSYLLSQQETSTTQTVLTKDAPTQKIGTSLAQAKAGYHLLNSKTGTSPQFSARNIVDSITLSPGASAMVNSDGLNIDGPNSTASYTQNASSPDSTVDGDDG